MEFCGENLLVLLLSFWNCSLKVDVGATDRVTSFMGLGSTKLVRTSIERFSRAHNKLGTSSIRTRRAAHVNPASIFLGVSLIPLVSILFAMLRNAVVRSARSSSALLATRPAAVAFTASQQRYASAHAISNPTLANIEKRWEAMPPQEQADLWMALRDRMKTNWSELTLQEKKAGTLYAISMARLGSPYSLNDLE